MSLTIMIGSDIQDYENLKNTIHFLSAIEELKPIGIIDDERFRVLQDLTEWYKTMYDVLTNNSSPSDQLYDPSEIVDGL